MSGGTDKWMPLHIGDYLADTPHLSTTEHGAYCLLLMAHWRLGHLPDDDAALARIAKLRIDHWRRIAGVIRNFFGPGAQAGTLVQKRLMVERDHARDVADKRAAAARGRWSKNGVEGEIHPPSSRVVASNDSAANPLKNKDTADANAPDLHMHKQTHLQNHIRDSLPLTGKGAKAPRRQPAGVPSQPDLIGAKVVPLATKGGEAPSREALLKAEGRAILKARCAQMPEGRTYELMNSLALAHGGDLRGVEAAVEVIQRWCEDRDTGRVSEALEPYLRGVIAQQKAHGHEAEAPRVSRFAAGRSRYGFPPIPTSGASPYRASSYIDSTAEEVQ
jgi:uncharacterized protein YdaU (DUF1376 family)